MKITDKMRLDFLQEHFGFGDWEHAFYWMPNVDMNVRKSIDVELKRSKERRGSK